MKNAEIYFEKARKLPLTISFAEVKSLIQLKGVTKPPTKNAWWNLNNLIIMTTTLIISTAAFLYFSPIVNEEHPLSVIEEKEEVRTEQIHNGQEPKPENNTLLISTKEESAEYHNTLVVEEDIEIEMIESIQSIEKEVFNITTETEEIEAVINTNVLPENIFDVANYDEHLIDQDTEEENLEEYEVIETVNSNSSIEGKEKTISKEISMEGVEWFKLYNSVGDIEIKSWDQPKIAITATVSMKGKSEEDVQKGLEDFKLDLYKKGNKVLVKHNWAEYENCMCWPNRKGKVKTSNGDKVKIEKLEVTYQVNIPEKINLDLKNNYGDILIDKLEGNLIASLFKGSIHTGVIKGDLDLNERYGDANIEGFEKGKVVLFQAESKLGVSKELELKANYSKVELKTTEKLELNAFQSNIDGLGEILEIQGGLRYGDLNLEKNANIITLDLFQANIDLKDVKHLEVNSSYSKIDALDVLSCNLESAFQTKVKLNKVGEITGSARYSPIEVQLLSNLLELNTFQGNVKVRNIGASFQKLNLTTRYTDVKLNFNSKSKLNMETKTAYTNVSIPKDVFDISLENKNGNYSNDFKGSYGSVGSSKSSEVFINSFQGNLTVEIADAKVFNEELDNYNYKYQFMITPETTAEEIDSLILLLEDYKFDLKLFALNYDQNNRIEKIDGVIKYGTSSGSFSIDETDDFESLALKFKPGFAIEIK